MQRKIHNQHGAALIIGLVLLLAITILAVAAMKLSRAELMMAGQTQRLREVQNAAESGVERRYIEFGKFQTGWVTATPFDDFEFGTNDEILVSTSGRYLGAMPAPPGYSLDGQFIAHHFEIESEARGNPGWSGGNDPMQGVSSGLTQGFFIIGPGS